MDRTASSIGTGFVETMRRKRSLRKRTSRNLRATSAHHLSGIFQRRFSFSEQSPASKFLPIQQVSKTSTSDLEPQSSTILSFFRSIRSKRKISTAPATAMTSSLEGSDSRRVSFNTTPRSFRRRFQRNLSRLDAQEPWSSPIDIPSIQSDVDPLQKPFPVELADADKTPLELMMLNSPSKPHPGNCSPTESISQSPAFRTRAKSPMPGTTFPLDIGEDPIPFEQAYVQIEKQSNVVRTSFAGSPKTNNLGLTPGIRHAYFERPEKYLSGLGRLHTVSTPTKSPPKLPFVETQNSKTSCDETLKEVLNSPPYLGTHSGSENLSHPIDGSEISRRHENWHTSKSLSEKSLLSVTTVDVDELTASGGYVDGGPLCRVSRCPSFNRALQATDETADQSLA